ncbi:MAG: LPXTG cell wall anchor domain-containing protein, partial [Specibacter sp.]
SGDGMSASHDSPSSSPAASPAPNAGSRGDVSLNAGALVPGGRLTITGKGFKPGTKASFTLHSTPVLLGTAVADANGVVTLLVSLPVDVAPGKHRIVIDGVGVDGKALQVSAALTVTGAATSATTTPAAEDDLANTGANATVLGGLAVLLLMAGAAVFVMNRRKAGNH